MKFTLFLCFILSLSVVKAQTFTKSGAAGTRYSDAWKCVAIDQEGNKILAGNFRDTVRIADSLIFPPPSVSAFSQIIVKLNQVGEIVWILKEINNFPSSPNSITVYSDGSFAFAYFGNNANNFSDQQVFTGNDQGIGIVKISKNGVLLKRQFIKAYNTDFTSDIFIRGISIDTAENICIAGSFFGRIGYVLNGTDATLICDSSICAIVGKLDSNLNIKWIRQLFPSKRDYVPNLNAVCSANGIANDVNGNIIVAGDSRDSLYLGIDRQHYLANAVLDSSSRFLSPNPWLLKFDPNGNVLWGKMGQGIEGDVIYSSVVVDRYNNYYVGGKGKGGFRQHFPYIENDTGNVINAQQGFVFNKFSPDGEAVWLRSTQVPLNSLGGGESKFIMLDSVGSFYVAGPFTRRLDFDPDAGVRILNSTNSNILPGATDFVVAKYSKTAQLLWVSRTTGSISDPADYSGAAYCPKTNSVTICGDYFGRLTFNGNTSPSYTSQEPSDQSDAFYATIANNCLSKTQTHDTICYGTTKTFDGETLTKPGKYIRLKSYNTANQCEVWEELYLHVRPEIQASAGADASVCSGKSQQLGTDSLSGLSYQWLQVGGNFTNTQARPKLSYTNFSDSIQRYRFALQVTDSKGCQKLDTVQLAISPVLRDSLAKTICPGETFEGYSTSGTYKDTLVSSLGCDSIRTLTLNYDIPNNSIQLSAEFGALAASNQDSYQWLDCNAGFAPIPGETDSSFAPTVSGSYAVKVTKGNCADTSSCLLLVNTEPKLSSKSGLNIFPNPALGFTTIDCPSCKEGQTIEIFSTDGTRIKTLRISPNKLLTVEGLPAGVYTVRVKGHHFIPEKLVIW